MSRSPSDGLRERIDAIEEAYEFMLAYAAQGVTGDEAGGPSNQIREQLRQIAGALEGLAALLQDCVDSKGLQPGETYAALIEVIARDAQSAQAAVRLLLAQASISSQLIDNLNAWTHLRALLTDLFLIDEILKPHLGS